MGGAVRDLLVGGNPKDYDVATHEVAGEPGITQPVQHAQRVGADVLAGDGVLIARNHAQAER